MGFLAFLWIFPSQGLKPSLLHYRRYSLPSETPGEGKNTGVGSLSFPQGIFLTQGSKPGLLHCRQIFHCLSHRGSPNLRSLRPGLSVKTNHCFNVLETKCFRKVLQTEGFLGIQKLEKFPCLFHLIFLWECTFCGWSGAHLSNCI